MAIIRPIGDKADAVYHVRNPFAEAAIHAIDRMLEKEEIYKRAFGGAYIPPPPMPPNREEVWDVSKLPCFKQVLKVLKYNDAVFELGKAQPRRVVRAEGGIDQQNPDLYHAFDWSQTPQGHMFWSKVRDRV